MKITLVLLTLLHSAAQVHSEKYPKIGACYYFYHETIGHNNITLVCVENARQQNFFMANIKSVCLNQKDYSCCSTGYEKHWIGTINFQDCERPELPNNLFKVYANIHTFNLSHVGLTSLPVAIFSDAGKLKFLDVSYNEITEIPQFSSHKSEILSIDFSFNKIKWIDHLAFAFLFSLKRLDLSHNELTTLDADILPTQMSNMKMLSIGNNQLRELKGFGSTRILDMKIVGIVSNRFNCSYRNDLLTAWKSINANLESMDCSLRQPATVATNKLASQFGAPMTSTSTSAPPISEQIQAKYIQNTRSENAMHSPREETEISNKKRESLKENVMHDRSNELSYYQDLEEKHEHSVELMDTTLLINTITLVVIAITLIAGLVWMMIQKRMKFSPKKKVLSPFSPVTFRRGVAARHHSVESNEYEDMYLTPQPPARKV